DRIDDHRVGGNVAAHHAERLAERAFDDVDLGHHPVAFGDARAAGAVHADRVNLVEVGHGAVLLGQRHGAAHVGDVAVHGIDALEGDQLGRGRIGGGQQILEVTQVVVAEDVAFAAPSRLDAADHRIVVQRVGEDDQ